MYGDGVSGAAGRDAFPGAIHEAAAPTGPPRPRGALARSIAIAVLAACLSATAGTAFVAIDSAHSWFPKKWDPQIAPIADEVARLRGLDFVHPVPIEYLAPADFEKRLGASDDVSNEVRSQAEREEAVFRALGFLGGKDDLLKGFSTSESSGTLAFYSSVDKDIIVRGTTLDVEHRVTIAHELTHVLQDQHFDLTKLERAADASDTGDSSALQALVEGDATRIEDDYRKQLSTNDQREYERETAAESDRVGTETASTPKIINLLIGAPYEFGPSTIRVLFEAGGNDAVNDAITGPVPSTEVYSQAGDIDPPVPVDAPAPSPDGIVKGDPEAFGPFETFLTLALRIDPARALAVSDLVAGGRAITFESNGITCYRVALSPTDSAGRDRLLRAVQDWAVDRTRTSVDPVGDLVGFTACDPGTSAPQPSSERFQRAVQVLTFRSQFTVSAATGHQTGEFARCAGRIFLAARGAEALVLATYDSEPTSAQIAQIRAIAAASGAACRNDSDAGLP
jgi:hypothetical protein